MRHIPLRVENSKYCALAKAGSLSDTIESGSPCWANATRKVVMVTSADVDTTGKTSTRFEKASMTTKKVCPMNIMPQNQHAASLDQGFCGKGQHARWLGCEAR